jgi:hypothetical protein
MVIRQFAHRSRAGARRSHVVPGAVQLPVSLDLVAAIRARRLDVGGVDPG